MRLITSKVRFTRPSDDGEIDRGFEHQRYHFRDDGTLTLTVLSVATDRSIIRDVIVNLDPARRPLDAYVRIHHGDRLEGMGWFRFNETGVEADLWNAEVGLQRQTLSTTGRPKAFSGHPIACDLLLASACDRSRGPAVQHLKDLFLSSSDHFGATGPEIAPVEIEMEYLGVEPLQTTCGQFDTDHWRILPGSDITGHTHPGEDMWAIRDTLVFVCASLPTIGYGYELTQFEDQSA